MGLMNLLVGIIVETTFEIARNDLSRQQKNKVKEEMALYEALWRCSIMTSGYLLFVIFVLPSE